MQSSKNWRRECKCSGNIANVHMGWGWGVFYKQTSAKTRGEGDQKLPILCALNS